MDKTEIKNKINGAKGLAVAGATALSTAIMCSPVFAAADLEASIKTMCLEVVKLITNVSNPLCALALAICLLTLLFGRSGKSADSAMSWAKIIVIAFIVINCLGSIMDFCVKNFGKSDTQYTTTSMINLANLL